ncbi:MAG: tRNA (adenine-N1)-methyltransferase [Desulfovibrionaceae bacterium]
MIPKDSMVLLVSPRGKRYLRRFDPAGELHTHDGKLLMAQVAEAGFGRTVRTHLGKPYQVLKPTVHDLIKGVKRHTQIMYPKEIGYLLLKMGIAPGCRVIEAGSGSGGLTVALACYVGENGKVYTYERREEFFTLAGKNLARVGLEGRVEQTLRDVRDGFVHTGADALFLDVRTPWEVLEHIPAAVIPGAMTGYLLPTTNQVSDLLRGLEQGPFCDVEVVEILVRRYKPVADRLRPEDRMVAHTGFLVFARCLEAEREDLAEDAAGENAPTEPLGEPLESAQDAPENGWDAPETPPSGEA